MQDLQITLPIGTIIKDRYIVEGLLGKGGFGAVYLVRDQRVKGNLFALKEVIDPNKQERARFTFEGEVLKRLDSPTLPRVYRVFEDARNNRAYMLMDYIEGPNLETLRQRQPEKRFPLPKVMSIMTPIMEAVSYLHSQKAPIIHRDIKPANIIVPAAGDQAMLVDFGIAKEFDPDSTTTAVRRCSPGYGAPEQYSRGTNTRTDIYGLGATIYAMLTGMVPDDAFYRMTQLGSNGIDPLEPVHHIVPSVPPPVSQAIARAMSISSNDRFPTVADFWQALNAYPGWKEPVTPIPAGLQESEAPIPAAVMPSRSPIASKQALADISTVTISQEPTETRTRKRRLLPIFLLILALIIGTASAAGFLWSHVGTQRTALVSTATPAHQPKPTTLPTSTARPTVGTTPTSPPAPVYPRVGGTHNGQVHNTSVGTDASLTISLAQNGANISGNITIGSPLQGSGPISNGSVKKDNTIQFTVQGSNINPLYFYGTVKSDGSMQGSYCSLDQSNQCNTNAGGQGTWYVGSASAGSSSVSPGITTQTAYTKRDDTLQDEA